MSPLLKQNRLLSIEILTVLTTVQEDENIKTPKKVDEVGIEGDKFCIVIAGVEVGLGGWVGTLRLVRMGREQ